MPEDNDFDTPAAPPLPQATPPAVASVPTPVEEGPCPSCGALALIRNYAVGEPVEYGCGGKAGGVCGKVLAGD